MSIRKNGEIIAGTPNLYDTTGQNTDGAMTQKATTDELENKADLDLANVSNADMLSKFRASGQIYLKTTYVSGTSGYNIWSNGYCEQWGRTSVNGDTSGTTATLVKTMANTNYCVVGSLNGITQGTDNGFSIAPSSTTKIIMSNSDASKRTILWKVSGYLASGQY